MKNFIRSLVLTLVLFGPGLWAQAAPLQAPIVGEVKLLTILDANDFYSPGTMVVAGQNVIIPANLLIDLPANRLTLQQIFAQAPPACLALGQSGLAKGDSCNPLAKGASVSVLANVTNGGDVIAGEIFMPKAGEVGLGAGESVNGTVTYINHTDGYVRLNGIVGSATTGVMVRINDPESRHTVQQGLGCAAGSSNCSPDVRYGLDPDNYTISFTTGYPACIPSTVTGIGNRVTGSDAAGVGDPLCPDTNRGTANNLVPNSSVFAPIQLGDHLAAEGNFEQINGVEFLSAHTLTVNVGLLTSAGQPDYMTWDEVEWDAPGFQNQRVRMLMIGFTTLPGDNIDIFSLHIDPTDNSNHEFPLASTAGCEALGGAGSCLNQGIGGGAPNIFKVRYDVDFIQVNNKPEFYPCQILEAGGFPGTCPSGATFDTSQNVNVLSPISRELIGRSRNKQARSADANPNNDDSFDILGNLTPNGEYLTPVGIGHPEFVEINLNAVQTPLIFEGEPWNLDRRLGPGGCGNVAGDCDAPAALDPFPFSGLDPSTQAVGFPLASANEPRAFFPFGAGDLLPLSLAVDPPAQGIVETPQVALDICAIPVTTPSTATGVTLTSDVASPQASGTPVTFTASADPVIGTFEYRFQLKTGATWAIVQDFSAAATFPWDTTGLAAGQYFVQVDVRGAGATAADLSAVVSYSLNTVGAAAPATGVDLIPDLASPQVAGTPITFTAAGQGSTAYEYRFWLKTGATWAVVQNYSTTATWAWDPSGVAGDYSVQVDVRGQGTATLRDAAKIISYKLTPPAATGVSLSPDLVSGTVTAGAPVTFTALGQGGSGTYEYRFWLKTGATWAVVQGYSTADSWVWDPSGVAGDYFVQVDVRSQGSGANREAAVVAPYTLIP